MNRSGKIRNIVISCFVVLLLFFGVVFVRNIINDKKALKDDEKEYKIESVLKTKEYSYLPDEAKDYIRQVFNDTGEILLTEENKEENTPYLNPYYVLYLTLSDEEKEKQGYIPSNTIVDYVYSSKNVEVELPSSYDLRNVNGVNQASSIKNQSPYGLCWAFASISSIESNMLKRGLINNNLEIDFSERQVDFATAGASNIIETYNPYSYYSRKVTEGGNFFYLKKLFLSGISPVEQKELDDNIYGTWEGHDTIFEPTLPMKSVLDNKNSSYTVTDLFTLQNLNSRADKDTKKQYREIMKQHIMNDGSLYVSTISPTGGCSNVYMMDDNRTFVINNPSGDINSCTDWLGDIEYHAMSIIGWDDNYHHEYCSDESNVNEYTCVKTGYKWLKVDGAWLIQNSWGSNYTYGYMSYENPVINEISGISNVIKKDWDNNYNATTSSYKQESNYETRTMIVTYDKLSVNQEKLVRISLEENMYNYSPNELPKVYINAGSSTNNNFEYVGEIEIVNGIASIDINNIDLSDNYFSIKVVSEKTESGSFYVNSISAYTRNVSEPTINSEIVIKKVEYSEDYLVNVITSGIETGALLTYQIYDSNNKLVIDDLSISNSYVINNTASSKIKIVNNLIYGQYTLKVFYNNEFLAQKGFEIKSFDVGEGTIDNPYIIASFDDLKNVCLSDKYRNSHYALDDDISYDSYYYPDDWEPLCNDPIKPFEGTIDGRGHSIQFFSVNNKDSASGLFGYAKNAEFKNIVINYTTFIAGSDSGILVANADNVRFDQIVVFGSINMNNSNIGGIVGISTNNTRITNSYVALEFYDYGDWNDIYPFAANSSNLTIDDSYSVVTLTKDDESIVKRIIANNNELFNKSYLELRDKNTYLSLGFDFDNIWEYKDGKLPNLKIVPDMFIDLTDVKLYKYAMYGDNDLLLDHYMGLDSVAYIETNEITGKYQWLNYYVSNEGVIETDYYDNIHAITEGSTTLYVETKDGTETVIEYPITVKKYTYEISDLVAPPKEINKNDDINISFKLKISDFDFNNDLYALNIVNPYYEDITKYFDISIINNDEILVMLNSQDIKKYIITGKYQVTFDFIGSIEEELFSIDTINEVEAETQRIIVSEESIKMTLNTHHKIEYLIYPSSIEENKVQYKSSNENIVKVDENGIIRAVGEGEANVTVYLINDKSVSTTFKVNVVNQSIKILDIDATISCPVSSSILPTSGGECDVYFKFNVETTGLSGHLDANISKYFDGEFLSTYTPYVPETENVIVSNHALVEFDGFGDAGSSYIITISQGDVKSYPVYLSIPGNGSYNIHFDANGGTGSMNDFSLLENTGISLPNNTFTKEGFEFKYWSTTPDGSGEIYDDMQFITLGGNSNDITLYAIWDDVYKKGDIDKNGLIQLNDVILLIRKYLGIESVEEDDYITCDMDDNDSININDVIQLIRVYLGIE